MLGDWSSDSKWILYTKVLNTNFEVVYLYSLPDQKSYPVSDGMSDASEPVFDPNGEYIYFFASTDAGPVVNWFDLSSQDMKMTNSIYLATLRKDITSPIAKESDEENIKQEDSEPDKQPVKSTRIKTPVIQKSQKVLKIETHGITDRIVNIPVIAGNYSSLGVGASGEILYIVSASDPSSASTLHKYDLKERKEAK